MSRYLKFRNQTGGCLGCARAENTGRAAVALTGQRERWKIFAAKVAGCVWWMIVGE